VARGEEAGQVDAGDAHGLLAGVAGLPLAPPPAVAEVPAVEEAEGLVLADGEVVGYDVDGGVYVCVGLEDREGVRVGLEGQDEVRICGERDCSVAIAGADIDDHIKWFHYSGRERVH
jgi:hypothetical protein